MPNQRPLDLTMRELVEELHKSNIKRFVKRIVYTSFEEKIFGVLV